MLLLTLQAQSLSKRRLINYTNSLQLAYWTSVNKGWGIDDPNTKCTTSSQALMPTKLRFFAERFYARHSMSNVNTFDKHNHSLAPVSSSKTILLT